MDSLYQKGVLIVWPKIPQMPRPTHYAGYTIDICSVTITFLSKTLSNSQLLILNSIGTGKKVPQSSYISSFAVVHNFPSSLLRSVILLPKLF